MRVLTPPCPALLVLLLAAVGVPCVCFGHGEGPPPPPEPASDVYVGHEKIVPPRWSWLHWWEANRDPYLKILSQRESGQKPEPQTLQAYRDKAVKGLLEATKSEAWPVRSAAALALGRMDEPSALKVLQALAANDPEERVRQTVLVALGLLDLPEARDTLLGQKYPTDTLFEAGCGGLGLLHRADEPRVLAALQQLVGGNKPGLATISAWGLRRRPDPGNARFFQTVLLRSKSPWLASEAILGLGDLGDPAAIKVLAGVLLATKQSEQVAAWEALERRDVEVGKLWSDKVRVPVDGLEEVRKLYTNLSDWRNDGPNDTGTGPGTPTIVIKVGIERVYLTLLRASAAIALGRFRQPQAREALLAALALRDDGYSDVFKDFAIMSLARIGDKEIVGPLLEYLDPKIKDGKRKTLGEFESPLRGFAALALGLYARPRDTPQGPADPPGYDKVCQRLAERLADADDTDEVRAAAAMGLGLAGRTECLRLVHAAEAGLKADDDLLVGYTLLASAMIGDRNILEPARKFLAAGKDKDDTNGILGRRAAVLGLGLLDTPETIPILVDAWHLNYHVNREVAVAFALCQARNVTDPLVKLLAEGAKPLEKAFAARCLGELFSAERPHRLTWFTSGCNFAMKNRRMIPYQTMANEFLYTYLIPCFGDQWQ